jgi:hypothetical protein
MKDFKFVISHSQHDVLSRQARDKRNQKISKGDFAKTGSGRKLELIFQATDRLASLPGRPVRREAAPTRKVKETQETQEEWITSAVFDLKRKEITGGKTPAVFRFEKESFAKTGSGRGPSTSANAKDTERRTPWVVVSRTSSALQYRTCPCAARPAKTARPLFSAFLLYLSRGCLGIGKTICVFLMSK